MISGDVSSARTAEQYHHATGPRLSMRSADAPRGRVDGGWWPRSWNIETELPELLGNLRPWVGKINRVAYHLGVWGPAPRKMFIEGSAVHLEGFRSMDPHTVAVSSSAGGKLDLLVVPPGVSEEEGRRTLAATAEDGSTWSVSAALLERALCGSAFGDRTRAVETLPEERWESEGGHVHVGAWPR